MSRLPRCQTLTVASHVEVEETASAAQEGFATATAVAAAADSKNPRRLDKDRIMFIPSELSASISCTTVSSWSRSSSAELVVVVRRDLPITKGEKALTKELHCNNRQKKQYARDCCLVILMVLALSFYGAVVDVVDCNRLIHLSRIHHTQQDRDTFFWRSWTRQKMRNLESETNYVGDARETGS